MARNERRYPLSEEQFNTKGQQTKGVSRAGVSTKYHLTVTTNGLVVEGFLTGYDRDVFRRILRANNNIPGRKNRREPIEYDRERYQKRSYIERLFGKIKENRRLAVRYEKSDMNFLVFILIAFLKIYLC